MVSLSASAQPVVEVKFISSFGSYGKTDPGTFDWPVAIAIDQQGRLIIADNSNHRIQRCDQQGQCEAWGRRGSQLGNFKWPLGTAVDSIGRIFTSEAGNDRIQIRSTQGEWTSFGSTGTVLPGEFRLPAGIAIDQQDRVIIADEKNHRIQVCDDAGNCTAFGAMGASLGMFNIPRAVGMTEQGEILVADYWNHRIQICSYEGACTAIGSEGTAPGQIINPSGVTADRYGNIIFSDQGNNRIQICDTSGACTVFGEFGTGEGQFQQIEAVAIDDQDRVYVGDAINQNIQVFQLTYADDPPVEDPFLINPGLNDAWYDPAIDGQGFLISVFPEVQQMFVAWFTFDIERPPDSTTAVLGDPGHRWLTAQGPYVGDTANLTIFVTEGGVFDSAEPEPSTDPTGDGLLTIEFADCSTGLVTYEINSLGISGEIPIQRIVPDNVVLCEVLGQ